MAVRVKWVVLWSLWLGTLVRQPSRPLRVRHGALSGDVAPDGSHVAYRAIPYATYTGRFQAPGPAPSWNGIFDAHEEHIRCTQRINSKGSVSGQEDCLVLNVYTPLETGEEQPLKPVMVFIHGGGFRDGSGSPFLYGPEYLVQHDIILITFNYRLEVLGFLCLGIEEVPGNAGLKDQLEALKWVKDNIRAFGGDPDNITLFGESAGSASVTYHLLSPKSKGLFHKAILQSGSAMSPWAIQFEPVKTAKLLAKSMGHDVEDPKKIFKLFMSKTDEDLLKARVPRADGDVTLHENIFVPCIEKEIPGVDHFLTKSPYEILTNGLYNKVPIIIGYNNEEGLMFLGKENETTISKLDFYKAMPRDLVFPSDREKIAVAKELKKIYLKNEDESISTTEKLSRFEGETGITYPVTITAQYFIETNDKPVYMYKFSYGGLMNLMKYYFGFWRYSGATHADDLFYLFKLRFKLVTSFFEDDMINKMTTLWTNFAKFGNPTPEKTDQLPTQWPQTQKTDPHLLVIDKTMHLEPMWKDESLKFWNNTYTKFRRKE